MLSNRSDHALQTSIVDIVAYDACTLMPGPGDHLDVVRIPDIAEWLPTTC